MDHRPVTVGVIGAGTISDIYLKNMTQRFPILNVKSICASHLENARRKAEQYGLRACTLEEMLSDPEIEMVVNLTPAHAHYAIIKQALRMGKHVYTEKTITDSLETTRELVQLAHEKGLRLGAAPDTFLGCAIQTARKAIDDGLIGQVTSFAMVSNRDATFMGSFNKFRREPGGGACYNYVVYYITALVSLLGAVDSTVAMVETPVTQRVNILPGSPEFGQTIQTPNESQVYALLRLRSGVCGTFHLNEESALADQAYFAIFGTKGILYLPDPNYFGGLVRFCPNSYDISSPSQPVALEPRFDYEDNARGIGPAELAESIRAGKESRVGPELACHVLEVLSAMMESGKTNRCCSIHSDCSRPEPMAQKKC